LAFLEENDSLKYLELLIDFVDHPTSNRQALEMNNLQYLSLRYKNVESIKALISHIPLQKGGDLEISSSDVKKPKFEEIIPDIHIMHSKILSSSTLMQCRRRWIQLSGPDGSFQFDGPTNFEQNFKGLPLLSFDHIQRAYFELDSSTISKISLFPALETLIIDHFKYQFSTLLAALPSPEASPLLRTLVLRLHSFSKEFMEGLVEFAHHRQQFLSVKLDQLVLIC
jgi:hypothetical protein